MEDDLYVVQLVGVLGERQLLARSLQVLFARLWLDRHVARHVGQEDTRLSIAEFLPGTDHAYVIVGVKDGLPEVLVVGWRYLGIHPHRDVLSPDDR